MNLFVVRITDVGGGNPRLLKDGFGSLQPWSGSQHAASYLASLRNFFHGAQCYYEVFPATSPEVKDLLTRPTTEKE